MVKTSIEGEHFIPAKGPMIIVSNHISYLDGFAIGLLGKRRGRQIHFLAKEEIFRIPIIGYILKKAGQIPVERHSENAKDSLKYAKQSLDAGHCVGIFPEATMPDDLVQLPIKSGAIRLAQDSGIPIVVVGTWGAHEIWKKGSKPKLKFRHKHAIVVSPPYTVDRSKTLDESRADLENRMRTATAKAITRKGM